MRFVTLTLILVATAFASDTEFKSDDDLLTIGERDKGFPEFQHAVIVRDAVRGLVGCRDFVQENGLLAKGAAEAYSRDTARCTAWIDAMHDVHEAHRNAMYQRQLLASEVKSAADVAARNTCDAEVRADAWSWIDGYAVNVGRSIASTKHRFGVFADASGRCIEEDLTDLAAFVKGLQKDGDIDKLGGLEESTLLKHDFLATLLRQYHADRVGIVEEMQQLEEDLDAIVDEMHALLQLETPCADDKARMVQLGEDALATDDAFKNLSLRYSLHLTTVLVICHYRPLLEGTDRIMANEPLVPTKKRRFWSRK